MTMLFLLETQELGGQTTFLKSNKDLHLSEKLSSILINKHFQTSKEYKNYFLV